MPASNTRKTNAPIRPIPISISNRQKAVRLDLPRLQKQAEAALPLLPRPLPRTLDKIEVILVSPAVSGRLHRQFLGDPAPTDVITFHHGELVICPAIARTQRREENLTIHDEVLTYILHGLLHLCDYDDHTPAGFRTMKTLQTRLREKL
jgi:probable rRNA maturation factor